MRHRRATQNLGRKPSHRQATLRSLVINLVENGRIRTTVQKAKAARPLAERIITLGKKGSVHHRRQAVSLLGSTVTAKRAVKKVFEELSTQFAERPGGYTRILKLPVMIRQAKVDLSRGQGVNRSKLYGTRLGDNADMVFFELCEKEIVKPTRKKSTRGKKKVKKVSEEKPKTQAKKKKEEKPKEEVEEPKQEDAKQEEAKEEGDSKAE